MITRDNFDTQIISSVLQRGRRYFEEGAVSDLEETTSGTWTAAVAGTQDYAVTLVFKKDQLIDQHCNCPHDSDICKHVVAVLFALREAPATQGTRTGKGISFEKLLDKITLAEYKEFVQEHAASDPQFKQALRLWFADKGDAGSIGEQTIKAIKTIIRKHIGGKFFIGYENVKAVANAFDKIITTAEGHLRRGNALDAFAIAAAALKEITPVITYTDDSSGRIGGVIFALAHLIEQIAEARVTANPLKENIYHFLDRELRNRLYFDYGDFGYELVEVLGRLAIELGKPEAYLGFLSYWITSAEEKSDDYDYTFFINSKILFLKGTGQDTTALVAANMHEIPVRQAAVDEALAAKNFEKAKTLIEEGIQVADEKDHPGTVADWEKQLLQIAVLENDVEVIRRYAHKLAFDGWFDKEYYQQWKATYAPGAWVAVIDAYIAQCSKEIERTHKANKGRSLSVLNADLLEELAPIFIEEAYWEKLLALVQQEKDFQVMIEYHPYLAPHYPAELLKLYLPALEMMADKSSARSHYSSLAGVLKSLMTTMPDARVPLSDLTRRLIAKYPRRPAMVEELGAIPLFH